MGTQQGISKAATHDTSMAALLLVRV